MYIFHKYHSMNFLNIQEKGIPIWKRMVYNKFRRDICQVISIYSQVSAIFMVVLEIMNPNSIV